MSAEEHLQLYNWLDDYIYTYKLAEYLNFVSGVLMDKFLETIIPHEDLSTLFSLIMKEDIVLLDQDFHVLKEKIWTKEALAAEKKPVRI